MNGWPSLFSSTVCGIFILVFAVSAPASQEIKILPDDETFEGFEPVPLQALLRKFRAELFQFTDPKFTEEQKVQVLEQYKHLDPQRIIPRSLIEPAILYFQWNHAAIRNKAYITLIDFKKISAQKRFYIVNMATGSVWSTWVAHGEGSDRNDDGYAEKFLNVVNSKSSSLGFYLTAESYMSDKNGLSMRLDGLSPTNSKARDRAVVFHGAHYVKESNIKPGRSWGCPAVAMPLRTTVVNWLKEGSIIYAAK